MEEVDGGADPSLTHAHTSHQPKSKTGVLIHPRRGEPTLSFKCIPTVGESIVSFFALVYVCSLRSTGRGVICDVCG